MSSPTNNTLPLNAIVIPSPPDSDSSPCQLCRRRGSDASHGGRAPSLLLASLLVVTLLLLGHDYLLCGGLRHDFQNTLHLREIFEVNKSILVESMGGHLFAFDTANLRQPLRAAMVCPAINRCEKEDYERQ